MWNTQGSTSLKEIYAGNLPDSLMLREREDVDCHVSHEKSCIAYTDVDNFHIHNKNAWKL